MKPEYYLILMIATIIVIALCFISYAKLRRKKSRNAPSFLRLYEALGKGSNILSLSREHDRLRIRVRDKSKIDQVSLKELGIPAIAAQGEIKLLIRKHSQEALSYLNEKRKEDT